MRNSFVRILFFVFIVILISVSLLTFRNLNNYTDEVQNIRHSNRVLIATNTVLSSVRDAETGHRGFQLTRDSIYLEPYFNSLNTLPGSLEFLDSLVVQDQAQAMRVDTLRILVSHQFLIIIEILSNASRSSLYMDQYESTLLKRGKKNMDAIRKICGSIQNAEQIKFQETVTKETTFRENTPITILAYALVALIGMTFLFTRVLESLNKRKIAEENLQENVEQLKKESVIREFTQKTLRNVLDNSLDGIMAFKAVRDSKNGSILDFEWIAANETSLRSIKKNEKEIVGQHLLKLLGNKDGLFDVYVRVVETGQSQQIERLFQFDGLNNWYFITVVKLEDGFVVTFSDITQQKIQQLQAEEHHLVIKEAESLANMGSWRWYSHTNQMIWSDSLYKIFGLSKGEVAPSWESFLRDVSKDDRKPLEDFLDRVKSKRLGSDLSYRVEINGNFKYLRMTANPRETDMNQSVDVLGTVIDITSQKLYEIQLKQFTEELQRSNRDLEQFAYVASHDLQEPLRKIQAFGDRLVNKYEKSLDASGVDYIQRMQKASARMQVLIEDLLAFSRVSRSEAFFENLDLNLILEEVLDDLDTQVKREEGKIIRSQLPHIYGERVQVKRLMQNLVSNALKFHKPGVPPIVEISGTLISWQEAGREIRTPLPEAHYIRLKVKDNGIGFDEKYAEKIFNIFQRLHGRMEYEGTGIGLAICRKIVANHNGYITVASKEGVGSEFIVILPMS